MLLEDRVLIELHRSANLAGRPGVALLSQDLRGADQLSGGRASSTKAVRRLAKAGKLVPVRRDLAILRDGTGLLMAELVDVIDAVAPRPYLITGGRALEQYDLTDQHFFTADVLVPAR